jgi:hypothetical protein
MATTGLIITPNTGDNVSPPVQVQVGYSCTGNFMMACDYDGLGNLEVPQQVIAGTSPNPYNSSNFNPANGLHTFDANDVTNGATAATAVRLDTQPGVTVQMGQLPITGNPGSGGISDAKKKQKPISGTTVATAVTVVCLIFEIDLSAGTRTIIAVGMGKVKSSRQGKYTWSIQIKFKMKSKTQYQYIARATAYNNKGAALGTTTIPIKKT